MLDHRLALLVSQQELVYVDQGVIDGDAPGLINEMPFETDSESGDESDDEAIDDWDDNKDDEGKEALLMTPADTAKTRSVCSTDSCPQEGIRSKFSDVLIDDAADTIAAFTAFPPDTLDQLSSMLLTSCF